MNDSGKRLGKLVELARRGRPEAESTASPHFAVRVAARWSSMRDESPDFVADVLRLGRFALALAVVVLVVSLVVHRPAGPDVGAVISSFAGIEDSSLNGI